MFNIFKKQKKENMVRIEIRQMKLEYDSRGYPLRLRTINNDVQMWIDNGDVVLKWKY